MYITDVHIEIRLRVVCRYQVYAASRACLRFNMKHLTTEPEEVDTMEVLEEQFVVNAEGERVAVLLNMPAYQKMLDAMEELEDIRAYDAAKASGEEAIPFAQALAEIERQRA